LNLSGFGNSAFAPEIEIPHDPTFFLEIHSRHRAFQPIAPSQHISPGACTDDRSMKSFLGILLEFTFPAGNESWMKTVFFGNLGYRETSVDLCENGKFEFSCVIMSSSCHTLPPVN